MSDKPETNTRPLDPSIYDATLDSEILSFMKSSTGIQDDDELRAHVLHIQKKAYAVYPYPCIGLLHFMNRKISSHVSYQQALKLGREREGALLLEIGCCFGMEMRRAAADGFPAKQIVASDLYSEFWEFGHALFRTTPQSFPATFLAGDALDPDFLSPLPGNPGSPEFLDLSTLTTLNPLKGKVSAIYARSLFHLFNEDQQCQLAHSLGSLLSPQPGSVIFGSHMGNVEKGTIKHKAIGGQDSTFFHSPQSWKELWCETPPGDRQSKDIQGQGKLTGPVFRYGEVSVEANTRFIKAPSGMEGFRMDWSVTRL
ncbi:hypothetical protein BKA83DRAFT_4229060 [Pisolithus microcarpus]|nr:hypothetical protein BKA83DRAFT_4229060 [Pisolithus microcarpus]